MKVIVSARLKPSQIKYKIIPLANSEHVDAVYLLRKEAGPEIPKVTYILLPSICKVILFNVLLTPFILTYHCLKTNADIIVTYNFLPHGFFGYIASRLSGIPFNYSQIDTNTMNLASRHGVVGRLISGIIKRAAFINVPGRRSKDFWMKYGIESGKIHLLHSTVDTTEFSPKSDVEKVYDLTYVGVLESRKRIGLILDAMAMIKSRNAKFAIVGDGPEKPDLMRKVNQLELGDRVTFFGYQDDVKPFILKSKAFVLASMLEGIPCALLESMACKLIPIVTDVADIADVVFKDNGFLLSPNPDAFEIARKIDYVLSNYDGLSTLKDKARKTIIDHHSYRAATLKWDRILFDLKRRLRNESHEYSV